MLVIVIVISLILFLIKKLKYNSKQGWKSVCTSFLITMGVQVLLLFVGFFLPQPMCTGSDCPSNSQILIQEFFYTTPIIFLIVILFYYMTKFLRQKKSTN